MQRQWQWPWTRHDAWLCLMERQPSLWAWQLRADDAFVPSCRLALAAAGSRRLIGPAALLQWCLLIHALLIGPGVVSLGRDGLPIEEDVDKRYMCGPLGENNTFPVPGD